MPTEKDRPAWSCSESMISKNIGSDRILDTVADLVFVVDCELTILSVNHAMTERFGCSSAELIGRKCFEVIHGTDSPPDTCPHADVMTDGSPATSELPVAGGGVFSLNISPLFNSEGQLVASLHIARDVNRLKGREELQAVKQTELEEKISFLEARIEKLTAELHKKDEILIQQSRFNTMGEMIGTIAHQWRQPLNNIGLIVQSLQIAYKADDLSIEELDQDVADTMQVVQSISETIEDFRNFFCREDEPSTFSINELFLHSLSFVGSSLKRKGIRIEIDEEADVTVEGYPNGYSQAVFNIILNARDVLLDRQVAHPLIKIRICSGNGHSVVTVRDNGGGIQEDILTRIFDPCFTTRVQEKAAGIGLFMAKMIIERKMHGRLSVRNVEDGAEFRIEV